MKEIRHLSNSLPDKYKTTNWNKATNRKEKYMTACQYQEDLMPHISQSSLTFNLSSEEWVVRGSKMGIWPSILGYFGLSCGASGAPKEQEAVGGQGASSVGHWACVPLSSGQGFLVHCAGPQSLGWETWAEFLPSSSNVIGEFMAKIVSITQVRHMSKLRTLGAQVGQEQPPRKGSAALGYRKCKRKMAASASVKCRKWSGRQCAHVLGVFGFGQVYLGLTHQISCFSGRGFQRGWVEVGINYLLCILR